MHQCSIKFPCFEIKYMTNALEKLFKECSDNKLPPVHLWNPEHCGDIGMKIDVNGTWFYQGSPIGRQPMVKLFSTILRLETDGSYVLVTPVEKIVIDVADVPFIGVEYSISSHGGNQDVLVRTNVDEVVKVSQENPLSFSFDDENQGVKPYIEIRNGLKARLTRTMTYSLLEHLEEHIIDQAAMLGIWSCGVFFPLGPTSDFT